MEKVAEDNNPLFKAMCDALEGKVENVIPSSRLTDTACCLTASGAVSVGMLKYFEAVATGKDKDDRPDVQLTLEINPNHPIFKTLKAAQDLGDEEKVKNYAVILYNQARLAEGLRLEDPAGYNEAVLALMK